MEAGNFSVFIKLNNLYFHSEKKIRFSFYEHNFYADPDPGSALDKNGSG